MTLVDTTDEPVLSTADLCDANAGKLQVLQPLLRHFGGRKRFYGQIETVDLGQGPGLVRKALGEPGHGRALVVDAHDSTYAAAGDNVSALAVSNKWVGVVIHGYIRDIAGIAKLPLGMMALGSCPWKTPMTDIGSQGGVIRFGETVFSPGQWLYADEDGVIVSPEPLL